jgi:hypothetical protein
VVVGRRRRLLLIRRASTRTLRRETIEKNIRTHARPPAAPTQRGGRDMEGSIGSFIGLVVILAIVFVALIIGLIVRAVRGKPRPDA